MCFAPQNQTSTCEDKVRLFYVIKVCIMKTELTQPFYKFGPCKLTPRNLFPFCYIVNPSMKHLVRNESGSPQIKKKIRFVVSDLFWKRRKKQSTPVIVANCMSICINLENLIVI